MAHLLRPAFFAAGRMAMHVVDPLEMVDVQVQRRDSAARSARRGGEFSVIARSLRSLAASCSRDAFSSVMSFMTATTSNGRNDAARRPLPGRAPYRP
jgi:hypothetical protein